MAIHEVNGISYHVDNKLMKLWERNSLEKLKKHNTDRVYDVDGRERSGKTTWAVQQMGVLDKNAFKDVKTFLSRIPFTPEEFNEAARSVKNGVIIFDEAFRGFSSRAALSKTNKMLIQTLMEMGQNNNVVFILLPSFFLLDIYPAMLRSDGLFHIAHDARTNLRKFLGYNRKDKNKIYQIGTKKGWGYPIKTLFRGRFTKKFPGGKEFEKAYLKKKLEALKSITGELMKVEESKYKGMIKSYQYLLKVEYGLGALKQEELNKKYDIPYAHSQINTNIREIHAKTAK